MQTVDFITPVVDDPYIYGQIAAANSLSDVFAMGGDVFSALNLVGFDSCNIPKDALQEILAGGANKLKECNGTLLGGHTIETPEMYYGLSVTGKVHPKRVYRNNSGRIGDLLVLTKPLGMGILTTAIKADLLNEKDMQHTAEILRTLNYKTSLIMREFNVSACTDITGFGLLGHALECSRDDISIEIFSDEVPFIEEAKVQASMGIVPAGSYRNRDYLEDKVSYKESIEFEKQIILNDAQTSGGLLVAIDPKDAKEYVKRVEELSFGYGKIIGEITPRSEKAVVVS